MRAVLRRRGRPGEDAAQPVVYRGRHLVADFDAVDIAVDGAAVRLTRREFELLRFLVENRNRVLSRERLLERVWGYNQFIETRSVDVHVGRLRAKLASVVMFVGSLLGVVIGPIVMGLLTDHVFADPMRVASSVAITSLGALVLAFLLVRQGYGSYRKALAAEESSGEPPGGFAPITGSAAA